MVFRVLTVVVLASCAPPERGGSPSPPIDGGSEMMDAQVDPSRPRDAGSNPTQNVAARFIIDGDTMTVSAGPTVRTPDGEPMDGEHVRLLGVDAPELAHPPEPAECWGVEARAFLESTIQGRIVTLEFDPARPIRGDFGRLLAYVKRESRVMNEALIEAGHARAFRRYGHRDLDRYLELESRARRAGVGLWSCPH